MAQVKPLKLLQDGNHSQIDIVNDDITASSFTSKKMEVTGGSPGEKLIIQANPSDDEIKLLNIKNAQGTSVASIDEDGDIIVNRVQANGLSNFAGQVNINNNLNVLQNLSVSGNVTLGNNDLDVVNFLGIAGTELNMSNYKITNLGYPEGPGDAANKQFVLDNLSSGSWSVSGNILSGEGFEFLGSLNNADVIFKRDDVELMRIVKSNYTLGGIELLEDLIFANTELGGDETLIITSREIDDELEDSVPITLKTGVTKQGKSGDIEITTGLSQFGDSGILNLATGDAISGVRGEVNISGAQINTEGSIIPNADLSFDLGSSDLKFLNSHVQNLDTKTISSDEENKITFNKENLVTHVDIFPEIPNSISIGSSGSHFENGFFNNLGSFTNTDFNLIQNNTAAVTIKEEEISSLRDINLNSNTIKNIKDPIDDGDAIAKLYFESYVYTNSWSVSGNFLSSEDNFEFIGSINSRDVSFRRNNEELIKLVKEDYNVGGVILSQDLIVANTILGGDETIIISTLEIDDDLEDSLPITLKTGVTKEGRSGDLEITTGLSQSGDSGDLNISTGDAELGERGVLNLAASQINFDANLIPFEDLTFDIGADGFNLNRVYTKNMGSSDDENVNLIRNNLEIIELQSDNIKHNIDINPDGNFSLNLGASGNHYDRVYVANLGTYSDTPVNILQNNNNKIEITEVSSQFNNHIIVQTSDLDNDAKVIDIKNSEGVSVAYFNEDGDLTVNDFTVLGTETIIGSIIQESDLLITGNLSVSGNVTLGDQNTDGIYFVGRSETILNMNSNKITNLPTATASGDAVNKGLLDSEITRIDDKKWDESGNELAGIEKFGSTNNQNVTMIRNNSTVFELANGSNISSVNLNPVNDNTLDLGTTTRHWSKTYTKMLGTHANDNLTFIQNNQSAVILDGTELNVDRHLVVKSKVTDNEAKIFEVKNAGGSSVAFIDEDGDTTLNNLSVLANQTTSGNSSITGNLSVSGNVILGDSSSDSISFNAKAGTALDMNSLKITSLATATASGDAVNKGLLDSEITRIDDKKWDESGNELAGIEKFGSTNNQNVTMIRNNATVFELANGSNISSVNLNPVNDNTLDLGTTTRHWSKAYAKTLGTHANDNLTLLQNNQNAVIVDGTEVNVDRHLVIKSKVTDNEAKMFEVKNAAGSSVAFIDEDGDTTLNNLSVLANQTLSGNLSVSGNVILGDSSSDSISFNAKAGTALDMNSLKITSLATATVSGDAVNKGLLDSEITRIDDKKWDESGNELAGIEKFGSTNNQNVTMIRNNATVFELANGSNISSVNLNPSTNNSLTLGATGFHWSSVFAKTLGSSANDNLTLLQNNQNAVVVDSSEVNVDRHLVIKSKVTDNEAKMFEVKNAAGSSVAFIDEDGDTTLNNLSVLANQTTSGNSSITGNLSVSGNVILGDSSSDSINFNAKAGTALDMNSLKITSLATATVSGDAVNKGLLDSEITRIDDKKWDEAGNTLAGTEKFGSTNNQNVTMIRNNSTVFELANGSNISSVNLNPVNDNTLDLGTTTRHWSKAYAKTLGTHANDNLTLLQNNQNAVVVDGVEVNVDRHLVIKSKVTDNEAKMFEIKNAAGSTVAFIDEDGDTTLNNLAVTANQTTSGNSSITGNLSVSGNVILGDSSSDSISFNAKAGTALDMNSLKITSLATATASGDAVNKGLLDSEITRIDDKKWDESGNILTGTEKFGSTNNQNVTMIRNNTTVFELANGSNISSVNLNPSTNNSLTLGATGFHWDHVYSRGIGTHSNDIFYIKQNNQNVISINSTDAKFDRHLVVHASESDNESRIFNVKNAQGTSVASIDEDGDMIVNNLQVNGVETVIGTIQTQTNLLVEGSLSVSGSTTLGNDPNDSIFVIGKLNSNINLNNYKIINAPIPEASGEVSNKFYVDNSITTLSNASMLLNGSQAMTADMNLGGFKITSLATATASGEAVNKGLLDSEITRIDDKKWDEAGNILAGTEKFGSTNNQNVTMIRNNSTVFELSNGSNISSVNLNPSTNNSLTLGATGFHWSNVYAKNLGTAANDILNIFQNNTEALSIGESEINSSRHLVIKGGELDSESKLLNLKNSDNVSVASLDGSGNAIFNNITVKGDIIPENDEEVDLGSLEKKFKDLYLSGSSIFLGSIKLSDTLENGFTVEKITEEGQELLPVDFNIVGDLSVSGSVILGSHVDTDIEILGRFQRELNLNSNKVVNLGIPTVSGDAVNLGFLVQELDKVIAKGVEVELTASGVVSAGAPVYILTNFNNTIAEGSATSIGTSRLVGISSEEIQDGVKGKILVSGFINIPENRIDGSSFLIGRPVYLSENTGKLTSTAPSSPGSRFYQVGIATSNTEMVIDIKQGITLS